MYGYKTVTNLPLPNLQHTMPQTLDVILPPNTILFRTTPEICAFGPDTIDRQRRVCSDTGKLGTYFATYTLLAAAIATENARDMELGVFITRAPIRLQLGKYDTTGNHFDASIMPLIDIGSHQFEVRPKNLKPSCGEVFVADQRDLLNIQLLATYKLTLQKLTQFLLHHSMDVDSVRYMEDTAIFDFNAYVDAGVLTLFHCP